MPSFNGKCRVGQEVKTPPFHGGITGSSPVRGTKKPFSNERLFLFCIMITVYVLLSLKDNATYVGMALDAVKRLKEHNSGKNHYTKGHLPWKRGITGPCLLDAVRQGVPYVVLKKPFSNERLFL